VSAVRSVLRHRQSLVQTAGSHVQHMQKALTQMNLHLHHVIRDITGKTGLMILDAILAGERSPEKLAELRDHRIRASKETIAKALVGTWRREHLFPLQQALAAYRHYQSLLEQCDREIHDRLQGFASELEANAPPLPKPKSSPKKKGHFAFDLRSEMYRILGVDLTQIPGIDAATAHVIFCEIGPRLSAFPTTRHFSSWMGLCPDNRTSGGVVLSTRTRKVKNRVATALRIAAQTLSHSDSALGEFYRRMRARLGAAKAIMAAAHKLARILYPMLTTKQPYDESIFIQAELRHQQRRARRLQHQAASMGYRLIPLEAA
jgi:transposase